MPHGKYGQSLNYYTFFKFWLKQYSFNKWLKVSEWLPWIPTTLTYESILQIVLNDFQSVCTWY